MICFKYIMAQKHKLKIFSYDFHIDFVNNYDHVICFMYCQRLLQQLSLKC